MASACAAVRDDRAVREAVGRLRRRALVVVERAFPLLGATRSDARASRRTRRGGRRTAPRSRARSCDAAPMRRSLQHAGVRHVVRQRVLEHVGQLGMRRLLVDQLERAQLVDVRAHPLARLRDALEQAERELAADHRRHLDGEPRVVGQAIEPGRPARPGCCRAPRSRPGRAPARPGRRRAAACRPRGASGSPPRRRRDCPPPWPR